MLSCVSLKCKFMIFLNYCNKKMIIFFKKKILDKTGLRYYLCQEKYKLILIKEVLYMYVL